MTEATDNNVLPSVKEFSKPIDEQDRPKPLPEGDYVAEVVEATRKASPNTGKEYALIIFKVEKERYPHDFVGPEGGMKVRYMVMMEDDDQSRWNLKELFSALGAHLPKTRVDIQDLLGRTCVVTVKHEEYPAGSGRVNGSVKSVKKVA